MKLIKIISFVILFINALICLGQNSETWEFEHKTKSLGKVTDAQSCFNETNGNQFVFLRGRSVTNLYVLNANKKVISSFEFKKRDFNSVNLEGFRFERNSMKIVSRLKTNVFLYTINLNNGELKWKEVLFKSKKENYISTINHDNKKIYYYEFKKRKRRKEY